MGTVIHDDKHLTLRTMNHVNLHRYIFNEYFLFFLIFVCHRQQVCAMLVTLHYGVRVRCCKLICFIWCDWFIQFMKKKEVQIHFDETKQILAGAGYSIRNWFVMNASESMTRNGPRTTCVHQVGQYFNAFVASAGRCFGFHRFPSTWNDTSNEIVYNVSVANTHTQKKTTSCRSHKQ